MLFTNIFGSPPYEKPLSLQGQRQLLAQYRQQVVADTRYLRLEGITLPDAELTSTVPLQRVYIHIQALEQRQKKEQRYAKEQALLASPTDREDTRYRPSIVTLISRLGEYQYRRGQPIESSQRPLPVDPIVAIRENQHVVLLGAPGSGKSTFLRYAAHQTAPERTRPARHLSLSAHIRLALPREIHNSRSLIGRSTTPLSMTNESLKPPKIAKSFGCLTG